MPICEEHAIGYITKCPTCEFVKSGIDDDEIDIIPPLSTRTVTAKIVRMGYAQHIFDESTLE